jgi:hypothetical protein
MSKNTKELPTMPYRPFAETLDRIIGSTDEFKTKFYNAFEERRLKSESEAEEPESEEPESEEPESEEPESEEPESEEPEPEPESEEPSKIKSFFDNLFSGKQGSDLLQNISEPPVVQPTLTPSNAPQHKCVIREW